MTKIKFFVKILITFLLVGVILKFVGFSEILNSFKTIQLGWFIAAFALAPIFLFFKIIKWQKLVKEEIPDISFLKSAVSFLAGWGVALLTPARVGELARAFYFDSGNRLRLISLVIFDKIFDFVVLVFLALFGLASFFSWFHVILYLFIGIFLLMLLFRQSFIVTCMVNLSHILPFRSRLKKFLDGWKPISSKTLVLCLFYTFFAFFITIFQCYLLTNSFETVSLKVVFLVFPLVILSNAIPISIGGLGVREGAAVLLLSLFGVSKTAAINSAFLLFFINTIIPGLVGALFVSHLKFKQKREN